MLQQQLCNLLFNTLVAMVVGLPRPAIFGLIEVALLAIPPLGLPKMQGLCMAASLLSRKQDLCMAESVLIYQQYLLVALSHFSSKQGLCKVVRVFPTMLGLYTVKSV